MGVTMMKPFAAVRDRTSRALNGTVARMHTAAHSSYWNETLLSVAYNQIQATGRSLCRSAC
jgi:hypothetical protein